MDVLNDDSLPENTRKLWSILYGSAASENLSGFVLVGGTALSLRIGHRISEDLDFIWAHDDSLHDVKLPRQKIDKAIFCLRNEYGFHAEKISHPAEEDDFINDGLDLDDFQQDYVINGTKVTFFYASPDASAVLSGIHSSPEEPLRVATTQEIFFLKTMLIMERTKSRDYFDLYTLLKSHHADLNEAKSVIMASSTYNAWDVFMKRLSTLPVMKHDEGYHQLMNNDAQCPSLEDMREFFKDRIDAINLTSVNESCTDPESHLSNDPTRIARKSTNKP
jgi:predicted nucleotidyltransferase component of viral defense system